MKGEQKLQSEYNNYIINSEYYPYHYQLLELLNKDQRNSAKVEVVKN